MIRLRWLVLALVALPFAEFAAFFAVSGRLGLVPALALLVATSVLGVIILKGGAKLLFAQIATGRVMVLTGDAARNGLLVAFAGLLLAIPGFVTDALAVIALAGALIGRRGGAAVVVEPARPTPPGVVDLDPKDWREDRIPPPRLENR